MWDEPDDVPSRPQSDGPEVIRSRPEAQIKAVLQTKARILNEQQSAFLDEIIQKREKQGGKRHSLPLVLKQQKLKDAEEYAEDAEDDSSTVGIEDERTESATRLQKLSGVVLEQQKVYEKVMEMVKFSDVDESPGHSKDPASPRSSSRGLRGQRSSLARPATAGAIYQTSSETRDVNALIVAERLGYQQACQERFQDGHRLLAKKNIQKHVDLHARLEAAERHHAKQLEETLIKQKKKIIHTQEKHTQQQRMLRELQRSDEKQFTLIQAKCHPMPKKLGRPASSPANLKGVAEAPASETKMPEPAIYQETLQSHARYAATLAKYQQYVADNERCMEKNWRNVAPGRVRRSRSKDRFSVSAQGSKEPMVDAPGLKTSVNHLTAASRILGADSLKAPVGLHLTADDKVAAADNDTTPEAPAEVPLSPSVRYERRLERCRTLQLELEAQRLAKRAVDEARLADMQERGKNEVEKKAAVAETMVLAWESKSNEATAKRQQQKMSAGEEFSRKHEQRAEARVEFQQQRQQNSEERAALYAQSLESVLNTKRQRFENNERDGRSKHEEKAAKASARTSGKLELFGNRSACGKHAQEVQAVLARKDSYDKEFRNQVAAEIKGKLVRSTSALRKARKPTVADEALLARRPQSSTGPRSPTSAAIKELTLPPELVPTSGIFALSASPTDISPPSSPSSASKCATASLAAVATPMACHSLKATDNAVEFLAAADNPESPKRGRKAILVVKHGGPQVVVDVDVGRRKAVLVRDTSMAAEEFPPTAGDSTRYPTSADRKLHRQASAHRGSIESVSEKSASSDMYIRARARSSGAEGIGRSSKKLSVTKATATRTSIQGQVEEPDLGSDCESGDEELLQDMQLRSSRWLSEARRKAA